MLILSSASVLNLVKAVADECMLNANISNLFIIDYINIDIFISCCGDFVVYL